MIETEVFEYSPMQLQEMAREHARIALIASKRVGTFKTFRSEYNDRESIIVTVTYIPQ